ncbi:unnamed protein product [Heterobilharzia americana]|nr:unnamed protein product [Heterobilharzia americana]
MISARKVIERNKTLNCRQLNWNNFYPINYNSKQMRNHVMKEVYYQPNSSMTLGGKNSHKSTIQIRGV